MESDPGGAATSPPWSALSHTYGSADDVPAILSRLSGPDVADAREAVRDLTLRICHQGAAVNETTPYVFPLLLALGGERRVTVRPEVLRLLTRIADAGRAWHSAAALAAPEHKHNYAPRLPWEDHLARVVSDSLAAIDALAADADADDPHVRDEIVALRRACARLLARATASGGA